MKFKLEGIDTKNKNLELPKPIWFELLIDNFGVNLKYKFIFLEPVPENITQVKVQLDEDMAQLLYVDKILKKLNNKKILTFELVASSPVNSIWQNYVVPKNFEKLTVDEMFEKFCKPFGIESIAPSLKNCIPSDFFTTLGMTYWNAVCLFFQKNFKSTIFIDKNRQITTKFKNNSPITFDTKNPYLTFFKNSIDRTKIFSNIIIQLADEKENMFREIDHENKLAEELKINRTKFFKLPKQFSMLSKTWANTIIKQHNAIHKTVEIYFAKTLKPIYPGTTIHLVDKGQKNVLCVNSFYSAILNSGPISKLNCFYYDLIN